MAEIEKLVIISTTGPENQEKATLPFVIATAAQTVDAVVVVMFEFSSCCRCCKCLVPYWILVAKIISVDPF